MGRTDLGYFNLGKYFFSPLFPGSTSLQIPTLLLLLSSHTFFLLWHRFSTGCAPFRNICTGVGLLWAAVPSGIFALLWSSSSFDLGVHSVFYSFLFSLPLVFSPTFKICFYGGTSVLKNIISCFVFFLYLGCMYNRVI